MIYFDSVNKIFKIDTENSSYVFFVSKHGFLEHLYYGKRINDVNISSISNRQIYSFASTYDKDRSFALSTVLSEYPVSGSTDMRSCALSVEGENYVKKYFYYLSHEIYNRPPKVKGLPHVRGNAETLKVTITNGKGIIIDLYYVVCEKSDVICRNSVITNQTESAVCITKAASVCLDFYGCDFDFLTLDGMYLAERACVTRTRLRKGFQGVKSLVGATSHHVNPFFALCAANADDNLGEVYGFNLIYSSNFSNTVEVDRLNNTRVLCGINDESFRFTLESGQAFTTPQAVMTFTDKGLNGMSVNMHNFVRENIIESEFAYAKRPVVFNSWETSYFAVDENTIIGIAENAKECGADTVVLDDGWFRSSDSYGLGDWKTDADKFPGGLKRVSEKIHSMGLKFGIWIEPECVNVDSELFRKHPDWVLCGEEVLDISRNQYVLDFTQQKTVDYIADVILDRLRDANPDYIKWDFNRYAISSYSKNCPQGEVFHRQMLGVYSLIEKIKAGMPGKVLFETCSGGGGRFDLGMLYYSPMIWASDNTDPYERAFIQYGTSYAYPLSSISCHYTKGICTSGRASTPEFRYKVASFGSFGYEPSFDGLSDEEKQSLKGFSDNYRQIEKLNLEGDFFRLTPSYISDYMAYIKVTKDKKQALLTFLELNARGTTESLVLKIYGLDDNKQYKSSLTGEVLYGSTLKNVGIRIGNLFRATRENGFSVLYNEIN